MTTGAIVLLTILITAIYCLIGVGFAKTDIKGQPTSIDTLTVLVWPLFAIFAAFRY